MGEQLSTIKKVARWTREMYFYGKLTTQRPRAGISTIVKTGQHRTLRQRVVKRNHRIGESSYFEPSYNEVHLYISASLVGLGQLGQ